MAGITLEQAQAKLDEYLAAESAVLSGQDITIEGTRYTRADLVAVSTGVTLWNSRVKKLSAGARRCRQVVPR